MYSFAYDMFNWLYKNRYSYITENKRLSIWELCCDWWHCKLSLWQLTVPPVTTKLSNWRYFVSSDLILCQIGGNFTGWFLREVFLRRKIIFSISLKSSLSLFVQSFRFSTFNKYAITIWESISHVKKEKWDHLKKYTYWVFWPVGLVAFWH